MGGGCVCVSQCVCTRDRAKLVDILLWSLHVVKVVGIVCMYMYAYMITPRHKTSILLMYVYIHLGYPHVE